MALVISAPSTPSRTLKNKCTFTLWHKQNFPASESTPTSQNYVQINTLVDYANDVTIDVASLRSTVSSGYRKVSQTQVFAIEGLPNGTNMTVWGTDGRDALKFESDGLVWMADGEAEGNKAWCDVGEWNASEEEKTTRVR